MDWILNSLREIITPTTAAYALAAIGLNIHFGFTGLVNFGQAGFVAIGGYGFAISVTQLGLSWPLAIAVTLLLAVGYALLLGIPTLRLRADYLAIVTIACAEIIRFTLNSSAFASVTGGANGLYNDYSGWITGANPYPQGLVHLGPWTFTSTDLWIATVDWAVVAVVAVGVFLLIRSPWGLVLKGIREDEHAMLSLGKNVNLHKLQALVMGGAIGALAGILYVQPTSVQPFDFASRMTFNMYTMLILGGAATVFGPILGSMIFWVVMRFTDELVNAGVDAGLLDNATQGSQLRFVLVGAALVLLVVFRPQGILGNRTELSFDAK
ncbi:branched-chain amino acid ABC transporter permease [Paractinoplanes deccanensis]|uniref:Branched-chain amino acid ABC transporter permease n=1 Tax=Paractinoplanes deccanensis TaxID=113561 RepID=A0ABQ3XXU7_9ACTN|nr:branched-chain amino acid ABC transporter permease [Actinoplanes deccanensis]GID72539.1 branched-chain amino acid ABC transporter permease [Actinoplanes deccanensis]